MSITPSSVIEEAHLRAGTLANNVGSNGALSAFNEALSWLQLELGGLDAEWTLDSTTSPALTVGTKSYLLPTDFYRMKLEQGQPLVFFTPAPLATSSPRLVRPIGEDEAKPLVTNGGTLGFFLSLGTSGNLFNIAPGPDATAATGRFTVLYKSHVAAVSDLTVAINLPAKFSDAMSEKAAAALARIAEMPQKEAMREANASRKLMDLIPGEESRRNRQSILGRRRR